MAASGHEERFPPEMLRIRCGFGFSRSRLVQMSYFDYQVADVPSIGAGFEVWEGIGSSIETGIEPRPRAIR